MLSHYRMLCLQVLHNMGLELQPPHCSVSIPASEQGLLQVTLEDVRRLPRLDLQVRDLRCRLSGAAVMASSMTLT